ncbi:MAG: PhzF family phenazine biosynthesis protein [Tepidisphaeraceae bacterium]
MVQSVIQVDAFTDRPFAGNPAAVCVMPQAADASWMQNVAREMNLAETAFVHPVADGYSLRWFTPTVEVELCGHATLAAAHVLWETGRESDDLSLRFHSKSGLLTARRDEAGWIELDFPATPPAPVDAPANLSDTLGARVVSVSRSAFDLVVELQSDQVVRALEPDLHRLRALPGRGVIVTARADSRPYDFVSRFFAPQSGVDEDPVTGSAHCALGPLWMSRLGKSEMLAYQASPRGGVVRVRMRGDRVLLGGQAVTVLRGQLV